MNRATAWAAIFALSSAGLAALLGIQREIAHNQEPVTSQPTKSNEAPEVKSKITELRSVAKHRVLIIDHVATGKFLQIFWDPESGFIIDLPSQTLSEDELARASVALKPHGGRLETWEMLAYANGPTVGTQTGFNFGIGFDEDAAAIIAHTVLIDVFRFNESEIYAFELMDL